MHEAFAAQVLSVLAMLRSDAFAKARLGRDASAEIAAGFARRVENAKMANRNKVGGAQNAKNG